MQLPQEESEIMMIKGKRSKRPRSPSHELSLTSNHIITNEEEVEEEEEEDLAANCLMLLAKGRQDEKYSPAIISMNTAEVYQCKTCDKSFHSFQALGGHRASHYKKLLVLPNTKKQIDHHIDINNTTHLSLQVVSNRVLGSSRVHECSICSAEFTSGQALGGHMRRHRQVLPRAHGGDSQEVVIKRARNMMSLDLNLPAAPEEDTPREYSKLIPYATNKQVLVFSASPNLVHCHY